MTSIEWLEKEIYKRGPIGADTPTWLKELYEQAKEVHKQEIIDAVLFGMQKGLNINKVPETDNNWVNNYYKETFKYD